VLDAGGAPDDGFHSPERSAIRAAVRPTGKVNLIGLTLLLGLAAGVYSVVIFSPAYMDNIDATDAVAAAFNQVGQRLDEQVLIELRSRLVRIGTHRELNEEGVLVETPGLGVPDDAIIFEKNPANNEVTIGFRYVREVRLKPSSKWVKLKFAPIKKGFPLGTR
jgi:hypothetical protein